MRLIINGKEEIIEKESLNITDLLEIKEVKMPDMVTVELNGEIIDRENFSKVYLKDNDTIEFLYYMGGGSI